MGERREPGNAVPSNHRRAVATTDRAADAPSTLTNLVEFVGSCVRSVVEQGLDDGGDPVARVWTYHT